MRILLVCGSGASSGFMAANIRKAAERRNIPLKITARGEAEIENYIDDIDILLVGPHLAYILDEIEEFTNGRDVKVFLIDGQHYSTLDGDKVLDSLLEKLGDNHE